VERNAAVSYGASLGHIQNKSNFDVTQKSRNPIISFIQQEEGEFNKISNIARKKSVNNQSDFLQRFQDKQSFMNKDGPLGIVKNAQLPIIKKIEKIELNQNLLKSSTKQTSINNN
jgi:hypothetical protein